MNELLEVEEMANPADDTNKKSAAHAYQFLEKIVVRHLELMPYLDLHPNGNVIVCFRGVDGMLSIVFLPTEEYCWAITFTKGSRNSRGRGDIGQEIPLTLIYFLEWLEE